MLPRNLYVACVFGDVVYLKIILGEITFPTMIISLIIQLDRITNICHDKEGIIELTISSAYGRMLRIGSRSRRLY